MTTRQRGCDTDEATWLDAAIATTELAITIQIQAAAVFDLHDQLIALLLRGLAPTRQALEVRRRQMESIRALNTEQAQQLRDSLLALRRMPRRI